MTGERRIVTDYWMKPIPMRGFAWSATLADYDGAPDAGFQPIGYGSTEQEAIADLRALAASGEAEERHG